MLQWLAAWWNAVELWVLGLPFPFQFALVMVVLLPSCLVVAWLIDRVVDHASAWFGPSDVDEPPLSSMSGPARVELPLEPPAEPPTDHHTRAVLVGVPADAAAGR